MIIDILQYHHVFLFFWTWAEFRPPSFRFIDKLVVRMSSHRLQSNFIRTRSQKRGKVQILSSPSKVTLSTCSLAINHTIFTYWSNLWLKKVQMIICWGGEGKTTGFAQVSWEPRICVCVCVCVLSTYVYLITYVCVGQHMYVYIYIPFHCKTRKKWHDTTWIPHIYISTYGRREVCIYPPPCISMFIYNYISLLIRELQ